MASLRSLPYKRFGIYFKHKMAGNATEKKKELAWKLFYISTVYVYTMNIPVTRWAQTVC